MSKHRKRRNHGFYLIAGALLLSVGIMASLSMGSIEPQKIEQQESSSSHNVKTESLPSEDAEPEKTESSKAEKPESSEAESLTQSEQESASDTEETESEAQPEEDAENVAAERIVNFAMPVTGDIIKSFNLEQLQYSKTYGDMRLHTGIDIIGEEGTPVESSADGTVKSVTDDPLWGTTVVLEHSGGIETYYCGLNDTSLEIGQEIKMGRIVGTIGNVPSECLDESHLHFAIKQGDTWLSPLSVMGLE